MKKSHILSGLALASAFIGLSFTKPNTAEAATPDKTATVNYVSGYGIATWGNVQSNANVTGHYLPTNSQWLVNTTVTGANGRSWYLVGNNEWASEQYYDLGNENSSQSLDATITINYKPGLSVNIWTSPAMTGTNGQVKHGADYKTTQRQVVSGKTWYQIGANQWISGDYAKIKNESSRGQKVFSSATTTTPVVNNNQKPTTESTYSPANGKIIANRDSGIYHVPGGRSYDKVKDQNRVYFDTEQQAINAGYRKAKN
ncbi:SLAP domain-containing protein [Holzapfeliella sp. He02]|uniref:SLAP domain-containing protein n=1 Tax=Holzapfeliella saturejae TaxID=3082953 RepID=A0ABU8SJ22_9LACO